MKRHVNGIVIHSDSTLVDLHNLIAYENNSKIHSVAQLEGIAQSIKKFGFVQDIVIDENFVIVAGHGRYEAAAALGMSQIPCIMIDKLTDDEIAAYRILDNKLAEGGTDQTKLSLELDKISFDFSPFKMEFKPVEIAKPQAPTEKEYASQFMVEVQCADESDQEAIYKLMTSKGYECRVLSM